MPALAFAVQLLTALPGLLKAGIDVTTLITESTASLGKMQAENRDPTDQEWLELNQRIDQLRQELHKP